MRKRLDDYFDYEIDYDEEDALIVIVDGKRYEYEMTLSSEVSDDECCRVKIDDEYYYFG